MKETKKVTKKVQIKMNWRGICMESVYVFGRYWKGKEERNWRR